MALPREYITESCPIARSLEVIGERWTLLIIRDAFYGVRRFSDFQAHLGIPKAVLTDRLALLVGEGVLAKPDGNTDYELTDKGLRLWKVLWALIDWGNDHYVAAADRRGYRHDGCGGSIGSDGHCSVCGRTPDVTEVVVLPPRRLRPLRDPRVSTALREPRRLLDPIRRDPPPDSSSSHTD
jgi:DNA-binding HxlR family transcriptional regulator